MAPGIELGHPVYGQDCELYITFHVKRWAGKLLNELVSSEAIKFSKEVSWLFVKLKMYFLVSVDVKFIGQRIVITLGKSDFCYFLTESSKEISVRLTQETIFREFTFCLEHLSIIDMFILFIIKKSINCKKNFK